LKLRQRGIYMLLYTTPITANSHSGLELEQMRVTHK